MASSPIEKGRLGGGLFSFLLPIIRIPNPVTESAKYVWVGWRGSTAE
jgi:hypothetical protein